MVPDRYVLDQQYLFEKEPSLELKRVIMRFHSKNGPNTLNSPFRLGAEHFKKLSDMEHITFRLCSHYTGSIFGLVWKSI